MTTLQDIMGLITKRKIKTPSDSDYIISAAYTNVQETLKPQPKMEASLLSLAGIKSYVLASIPVTPVGPLGYKVYTALLTRTGATAPDAVVLENTIGALTFSYTSAGNYSINSANLFIENKTVVFIQQEPNGAFGRVLAAARTGSAQIAITQTTSGGVSDDDWNLPVSIEIRIYN